MALTRPRLLRFALHLKFELLERGREWAVLNSQRTSWVQTRTAQGKETDLTPPKNGAFITCTITFYLTCRFRMLDMRWKALDRAMNLSQVPAQGDAVFQVFFCDALFGVGTLQVDLRLEH